MGYLETLHRAMGAHGFTTFSPGAVGGPGLVRLDHAISAASSRFANVAVGADWDAISAQFAAMAPAVVTVSLKAEGGGLRVVLGRLPPKYDAGAERAFVEAAGNWMKAMRTAG